MTGNRKPEDREIPCNGQLAMVYDRNPLLYARGNGQLAMGNGLKFIFVFEIASVLSFAETQCIEIAFVQTQGLASLRLVIKYQFEFPLKSH